MGLFNRTKNDTVAETPSVAVENISGDYTLDPSHTRIGFSARHAMVTKVRGNFDQFEGSAHVDTANPANSSVTVTIEAASVTTGNEQRDGHLKTPATSSTSPTTRRSPSSRPTSSATAPTGPSPAT